MGNCCSSSGQTSNLDKKEENLVLDRERKDVPEIEPSYESNRLPMKTNEMIFSERVKEIKSDNPVVNVYFNLI